MHCLLSAVLRSIQSAVTRPNGSCKHVQGAKGVVHLLESLLQLLQAVLCS